MLCRPERGHHGKASDAWPQSLPVWALTRVTAKPCGCRPKRARHLGLVTLHPSLHLTTRGGLY